jgi:hypothetical protein
MSHSRRVLSHCIRSRSSTVAVQKSGRDAWHLLIYPLFAGVSLAAGEGFEPSLTDPESVVVRTNPHYPTTAYATIYERGSTGIQKDLTTSPQDKNPQIRAKRDPAGVYGTAEPIATNQKVAGSSPAERCFTITLTITRSGFMGFYEDLGDRGDKKNPIKGAFGELPDLDSNQDQLI